MWFGGIRQKLVRESLGLSLAWGDSAESQRSVTF